MKKWCFWFSKRQKAKSCLNGQCSSLVEIRAGVLQVSIMGLLSFLIYINDLSNDIESKLKLFADDTSLFFGAHDIDTSANDLNHGLDREN